MRPLPPIPTEEAGQSKDKKTSSKKVSKVKELNFFSIANKVHAVDSIKVMSIVVY